jgi:hypothetical protein
MANTWYGSHWDSEANNLQPPRCTSLLTLALLTMMSSGSYAPVLKEEDDAYAAHLQQNLVGPDPSQALPTVTSIPMMQVVAPATLPEGYEFQAVAGNRTFTVKVPPGGIEQGQKFEVPFPQHLESAISGISVPVGHWRDGLFEIFRYGACHPHCWTGCFCHLCTYS